MLSKNQLSKYHTIVQNQVDVHVHVLFLALVLQRLASYLISPNRPSNFQKIADIMTSWI